MSVIAEGEFQAIDRLLVRIREALAAGDASGMASCWESPSMVVMGDATSVLGSRTEIEEHCSEQLSSLHARGPTAATLMIQRMERLSEALASVDIAWSAPGAMAPAEITRYIMRTANDSQTRICVAILIPGPRTVEADTMPSQVIIKDDLSAALAATFPASDPVTTSAPAVRVGIPLRSGAGKGPR